MAKQKNAADGGGDATTSAQGASGDAQDSAENSTAQGGAETGSGGSEGSTETSSQSQENQAGDASQGSEEGSNSADGADDGATTLRLCCSTKVIGAMYDHTRGLTIPLMGGSVEVAGPIDPKSWLGVQMEAGLVQIAPSQSKKPEKVEG